MSYQVQSGDLHPFTEVVPESAKLGGLTKASILTQRRRCRIVPQTSPTATPNSQVQFLIADQGGLLDPSSIVLNYNLTATGTGSVAPDDGHPFGVVQVLLNGQMLDNVQSAMRVANAEMKLGGSQSYYKTAGSLQGFELLNNDLITTVPTTTASVLVSASGQYGYVAGNVADISTRVKRSAAAVFNGLTGEQRSVPLGLMSGFGRCATYIPLALLGELTLVLQTGSNADVMFQYSATQDATYSLANISLEYDIVVPDARYMDLLSKVAGDGADAGIHIPYESTIVGAGGVISSSSSALQESTIITSRATNHLLRASAVLIPSAVVSSLAYPSQSCFSHAGTWSFQFRIGSQVFPQIASQGDASMFNTSLAAYGAPTNENGSCVNRCLWGNSTNPTTAGTPAVYETADASSGGSVKFAYADSFIPSYGFRTVKGRAEPLDIDGVSLAGASGSQLITTLVQAPSTSYVPYVIMTALRIISARSGAVSVIGA